MTEPQVSAAIARLRVAALDQAAGRDIRPQQLIRLALDALLAGVDTPSLRMLAGLGRREDHEARELFDAVIDELDLRAQIPVAEHEALWLLARQAVEEIVRGAVDPLPAGLAIWSDFIEPLDYPATLMPLFRAILAANGWGVGGGSPEEDAGDIMQAARTTHRQMTDLDVGGTHLGP